METLGSREAHAPQQAEAPGTAETSSALSLYTVEEEENAHDVPCPPQESSSYETDENDEEESISVVEKTEDEKILSIEDPCEYDRVDVAIDSGSVVHGMPTSIAMSWPMYPAKGSSLTPAQTNMLWRCLVRGDQWHTSRY